MTNSTTAPATVKRNWNMQKSTLNGNIATLANTDFHFEAGKKDEILNKVPIILARNNGILASIISAI